MNERCYTALPVWSPEASSWDKYSVLITGSLAGVTDAERLQGEESLLSLQEKRKAAQADAAREGVAEDAPEEEEEGEEAETEAENE